jgi:integrase
MAGGDGMPDPGGRNGSGSRSGSNRRKLHRKVLSKFAARGPRTFVAASLDVPTISRRIGHASPAITLNVYGHLFSNTDTRAADIMQTTFAKVRSTD